MQTNSPKRSCDPVFAWKAKDESFAVYNAEQIAPDRSAHEQIQLGRRLLALAPAGAKLVGALPFDFREPGELWIGFPERIDFLDEKSQKTSADDLFELSDNSDESFTSFVQGALSQIELGALEKIVASRRFQVNSRMPLRPTDVFARISNDQSVAAFFCQSRRGTLVGASPEILVDKQGEKVLSVPLAGSRSRSVGDQAQASDILLHSKKDLWEHQLVVDQITEKLRSMKNYSVDTEGPYVCGTKRIWHLATDIKASISDVNVSDSLDMVELLHPTPAICGTPSDSAFEYILQHEEGSRGLYSGATGWQDQKGDGQWRVTLRCGLIDGGTAHVFSGAGLVSGSDIDEELSETKYKAQTFIDAL